MDKEPIGSPQKKRPSSGNIDPDKENSVPIDKSKPEIKKPKKIKYFFNPVNKLTSRLPLEKEAQYATRRGSNEEEDESNMGDENYERLIRELQSSDDSFDGIKWRTSPRRLIARDVPSSPLKETGPSTLNSSRGKSSFTFLNEQANSVLTKYGSEFQNIMSQTPRINRAQSDISSTESVSKKNDLGLEQKSPTLVRAKSSGFDTKEHGLRVSKLKSWMDKFEKDEGKENTTNDASHKDALQAVIESIHFSDDFSDSSLAMATEGHKEKHDDVKSADVKPDDIKSDYVNSNDVKSDVDKSDEDVFSDDDQILASLDMKDFCGTKGSRTENCGSTASNLLNANIDFDDFSDEEFTDTTATAAPVKNNVSLIPEKIENSPKLSFESKGLRRYQISKITERPFVSKGRKRSQILLDVVDGSGEPNKLIVRGEYTELGMKENDIIHVIITDESNEKLIDETKNLLIWNPDTLISATTVAQQLSCARKSVLLNRFKFPGEPSLPLLVGVITHSIFQACFIAKKWTPEFMNKLASIEIDRSLIEIFSMGLDVDHIKAELEKQLPYLESWFMMYYKAPHTSNNSILTNHYNKRVNFSATEALDIEENIWSPMFGIKGMVDVTLEAQFKDKSRNGRYMIPMEIKTGREHISHQAQTSLYSLLFKDRYDLDIAYFLLVYTKEKITKQYDISPTDLKSLVNARNRASKYFQEFNRELPELVKQSQCDRCEIQAPCMTINKMTENGTAEDSGISVEKYEDLTSHLEGKPKYLEFYNFWDDLITREEGVMTKLKRELWKCTAGEREKDSGKAIGGLKIIDVNDNNDSQTEFIYTFERQGETALHHSQLTRNDKIIISDEHGHFAIAQGFVVVILPTIVKISTRRRIVALDTKVSKIEHKLPGVLQKSSSFKNDISYRIDKDDMFHGLGLARFNLLNLFLADGDRKRRDVVVDLKKPEFLQLRITINDKKFNPDQETAFQKVFSSKDYSLILGMPGTGKTTVIAELIKYIVNSGKTVLLASYTHSAVDNILLKVKDFGIDILRVGSPSKVHKDIRPFIPDYDDTKQVKSLEDFKKIYLEPPVVASTCLGITDIVFNLRQNFDFCIIDEASQVSMPVSLGPLRFGDKFVLVGDHYQLPPLVQHQNPQVKRELSKSLFRILADSHPQSVVELTYQYRMCKEIMLLSNELIYDNRLKCGSDDVANKSLVVPYPDNLDKHLAKQEGEHWMQWILKQENKVLFLDHDLVPARERKIGEKVENPTEAELVSQIVESLLVVGIQERDIGVMSLYRSQLRILNRKLAMHHDIEILTADQFQGKDKECVIISLVRSNSENQVGDLIKEWRRVNVAITRSKTKLIILGSLSTLSGDSSMSKFLKLFKQNNWVHRLPADATDIYHWDRISSYSKSQGGSQISRVFNEHPIAKDVLSDMVG